MGLKAPGMRPQSTHAPTSALLHHPVRVTVADAAACRRLLRLDQGIHTSGRSSIRDFVSATTAAAPADIGCGGLRGKSRRIFLGIWILAKSITQAPATDATVPLADIITPATVCRRSR